MINILYRKTGISNLIDLRYIYFSLENEDFSSYKSQIYIMSNIFGKKINICNHLGLDICWALYFE